VSAEKNTVPEIQRYARKTSQRRLIAESTRIGPQNSAKATGPFVRTPNAIAPKTTSDQLLGIPAQQDTDLLQAILIRTEGTKNFYPTRCSFSTDAAEVPVIKHVTTLDEETSIQQLLSQDALVNVYLPNGALVQSNIRMSKAMSTLPSGMYVTNGQKFIVK